MLMGDCAQLDLGSMGTRLGTGIEAAPIQMDSVTAAISATRLTAFPNTPLSPRGGRLYRDQNWRQDNSPVLLWHECPTENFC